MKKTLISILLLAVMAVSAVSCGGGGSDITLPPEDSTEQPPVSSDVFTFIYKNTSVVPHAKMSDLAAGLGDPVNYAESESCLYQGLDKDYTYPGFKLRTYPEEGIDYVLNVMFTDDSVATPEGIMLGSTRDEVIAAYGSSYTEENGSTVFTRGKTELRIRFTDDSVSAVEYWALEG